MLFDLFDEDFLRAVPDEERLPVFAADGLFAVLRDGLFVVLLLFANYNVTPVQEALLFKTNII